MVLQLADSTAAAARGMALAIKGDPRRKYRLLILTCVSLILIVAGVGPAPV